MTFAKLAASSVAALVLGLSGCASTKPAAAHEHRGGPRPVVCPMPVPGTLVAAADIENGAVLTFTTPDDVNELRLRVRRMADLHDEHPSRHRGREMATNPSGEPAAEHEAMPASSAEVEDVEGGARVTLIPKDSADLDELRAHAREHAAKISRGECPLQQMK